MSDDVKKENDNEKDKPSTTAAEEQAAMRDWDRSNVNVAKPGVYDQPVQVLDHPEFEPDLSLVGKENKFGVMSDDQKRAMGMAVDENEEQDKASEAVNGPQNFGRSSGAMLASGTANTGNNAGQGPSLRVHGFSYPGNHIGAGLNYYTIYTTVDITPTGIGALIVPRGNPPGVYTDTVSNSQLMLDKLIETISLRAQPVVMSQITSMAYSDYVNTATPTFHPASGTVWSMSFAIEHNGAWDTMQIGRTNSVNPVGVARGPITGGPTPYNTNPDLTGTISSNLAFMNPPFINTGNTGDAATNNFVIVASGPF